MKVVIDLSEQNEGTEAPFWVIIDPSQMMKPDDTSVAMRMVHGIWFSREEANEHLMLCRHRYSSRAVVWCMSGHASMQWRNAVREARKGDDAFNQMYFVLSELKECSEFWGDHNVQIGMHERIDHALKKARGGG